MEEASPEGFLEEMVVPMGKTAEPFVRVCPVDLEEVEVLQVPVRLPVLVAEEAILVEV